MNHLIVTRGRETAFRELGDETIVMNAVDSTFFNLNEVGAAIWLGADGTRTLEQIVDEDICPAFDVPREVALADAEDFVRSLESHGILKLEAAPVHHA